MIVAEDVCVPVLDLVLQGSRVMKCSGWGSALDLGVLFVKSASAFQPHVLDELGQAHALLSVSAERKSGGNLKTDRFKSM